MQPSKSNLKFGLTSNTLKIIAIIAMTVDHVAWAIFPGFSTNIVAILMHVIGRIACPIFCFFDIVTDNLDDNLEDDIEKSLEKRQYLCYNHPV